MEKIFIKELNKDAIILKILHIDIMVKEELNV